MEKEGCPICGGKLIRKKNPYWFGNKELGEFEADVCMECKEAFYTEEASKQIDEKAKKVGIWGIGKRVVIGQSGNALMVRIPKDIAEQYNLHKKETVSILPEGRDRIAIEIKG